MTKPAAVKLTKSQLAELKQLAAVDSRESQGKGRVRIHNNLRRHGLATIFHARHGFRCAITAAGRTYLKALPKLSIEVVESATNEVVEKLGPFASERLRDKADDETASSTTDGSTRGSRDG